MPSKKPSKHNGVTAVEESGNSKIWIMSATYVSQASCWAGCPWLQTVVVDGVEKPPACYANNGQTSWTTNRLNKQASANHLTPLQLAKNEAEAIDGLTGELCRKHV